MRSVSLILQIACGVLSVAVSLTAHCAEVLTVTGPSPAPAGFAGSELEVLIRLENTVTDRVETVLFTRLWQQSSSILQPVAPRQEWWRGQIEAKGNVSATARVGIPEVRAATRFRLQVLGNDGRSLAQLPLIAIPKGWFPEQLAHFPVGLAVYDPEAHVTPALRQLRVEFNEVRTVDEIVRPSKNVALLVPAASEADSVLASARERAARGEATAVLVASPPAESGEVKSPVVVGSLDEYRDLSESAGAQYRFVTLLQDALRRKPSASEFKSEKVREP